VEIIVTGSRIWAERSLVFQALTQIRMTSGYGNDPTKFHIKHGGNPSGADRYASEYSRMSSIACTIYVAMWNAPCTITCKPGHRKKRKNGEFYCPSAGPLRNQQMVDDGADILIAFPLDSRSGTADCMMRAEKAGIPIENWGRVPVCTSESRKGPYAYGDSSQLAFRIEEDL
jgi:YspA, cpYpsA-related SLOG family